MKKHADVRMYIRLEASATSMETKLPRKLLLLPPRYIEASMEVMEASTEVAETSMETLQASEEEAEASVEVTKASPPNTTDPRGLPHYEYSTGKILRGSKPCFHGSFYRSLFPRILPQLPWKLPSKSGALPWKLIGFRRSPNYFRRSCRHPHGRYGSFHIYFQLKCVECSVREWQFTEICGSSWMFVEGNTAPRKLPSKLPLMLPRETPLKKQARSFDGFHGSFHRFHDNFHRFHGI